MRFAALALIAALVSAPALKASAAPPVEAYGRLPAIEMVRLSPSGERIALVVLDHGERRMLVRTQAGQVLSTAVIGDAKLRGLEWAGEDHVLTTLSATINLGMRLGFKHEFDTVTVTPLKGGKPFQVFQDRHGIGQSVFGSYGLAQVKGHWYGYFGGLTFEHGVRMDRLTHGYPDLYRVDLDSGEANRVTSGDINTTGWLVGADGAVVARSFYNDKTNGWRIVGADGTVVRAGANTLGGAVLLGQGRTPGTVIEVEPGAEDNLYLEAPLSGAAPLAIKDGEYTARWLFDPNTRLWVGATSDSDEGETNFLDPVWQARMAAAVKGFPGRHVQLTSFDAGFGELVLHTDGDEDSGTYWLYDTASGAASVLGMEYPDIGKGDVGAVRMVAWKASDGLDLRGVLTLPPGREAKNLPLVVLPHGGPLGRDYPRFYWWAQAFAARGYAVFQPNYRGSDGYGGKFRMAGWRQWGRKMQTDVSDGVAALAAHGVVDPRRACIVGGSYGGYVALAGVTIQQGLYKCAVSVGGVSDLDAMLLYVSTFRGLVTAEMRSWRVYTGANEGFATGLGDISPAKLAERADAPVLLIHGKDDTVAPIEQSREMERALRRAGKPVEFMLLLQEDHWLSREATRTQMLTAAVGFVEKYDPPDAAQQNSAQPAKP